jgi:glucose uptake protein
MVLVQNYALAVFLCAVAMVCWGSWQNTQNLIGKVWRFEHYYWDFSIGILFFALVTRAGVSWLISDRLMQAIFFQLQ